MGKPVSDASGDKGIKEMLIGRANVKGVTFQRPVAPPPIVQWSETGQTANENKWSFILEINITMKNCVHFL